MRRTIIIAAIAVFLFDCEPQPTTKKQSANPGTTIHGFKSGFRISVLTSNVSVCSGKVYLKTFSLTDFRSGCGGTQEPKMLKAVESFSRHHKVLKQKNVYDGNQVWYIELTVCDEKAGR